MLLFACEEWDEPPFKLVTDIRLALGCVLSGVRRSG
jgi:hypothetical protein